MAKIKQGILGGFSGKVANVVGTSWKGRAVMKSQPLSVANPRTTAQTEQRNKFSKISELASKVLTQFVQPVENPISGNISGYNLFCKDNKEAFSALGVIDATKLFAGGGTLPNAAIQKVVVLNPGENPRVYWDSTAETSQLRLTDVAHALIIDENGGVWVSSESLATREDGVIECTQVSGSTAIEEGDSVTALLAFVSADGRQVSVKTSAESEIVKDV